MKKNCTPPIYKQTLKGSPVKKTVSAIAAVLAMATPAFAADFATTADVEALVAKVAKALAVDSETTIREISAKDPKWVPPNSDLYPFVIDKTGVTLANGNKTGLAGKNVINLIDTDGKFYVKEYLEKTLKEGKSWTEFKVPDPVSKKILRKNAYCEKVMLKTGEGIVCSGIYKR